VTVDNWSVNQEASIRDAARRDWRWYAPAWAFPVVLLLVWHLTHTTVDAVPGQFTMVLLSLCQFAAFFLAASLQFRKRANLKQFLILGILVPFAIWTIAVFARGAILAIQGRLYLS
jgi:hypothetical protein